MRHILLLEDSKEFQVLIKRTLSNRYELSVAENCYAAAHILNNTQVDLMLVDVVLPDKDGFSFVADVKNKGDQTPIIFLTGKSGLTDKILGFSLGAEDYVVKPFEPLELMARIEARFRRQTASQFEIIYLAGLTLKIPQQKAYVSSNNADLQLTPLEFKILHLLAKNPGHLFSRNKIMDEVWGQAVSVSDRTVDTHIYTLRKKLAKLSSLVESVPGEGYRFIEIKKS
jgi:DNA-binding response OmpR family regulator